MKAVICTRYGPPEVLEIRDIPQPVPKEKEILIKIHATTVHIGDTKIRRLAPGFGPIKDFFFKPVMRIMLGFRGPRQKILGLELAGEVVAVGTQVTKFQKGDQVFGSTEFAMGAYAEYICIPEDGILTTKPDNLSFGEAAALPNGAITALNYLRKADIQPGQKVLIYGASGSVGTFGVQLAKHFGAEVTAVCSTKNLAWVSALGADKVIDYTQSDFTESGDIYDVIFDAVGKIAPVKRKQSLTSKGHFLNVLSMASGDKLKLDELLFLKELCEAGLLKVVIDRSYPLSQIVEAHRYVDQGHKKGHVVITVP